MPFVYISTFDSLAESSGIDNFIKLFSKGRPCWQALKDAYIRDTSISELYAWNQVKTLVKAKLQEGNIDFTDIDEETKNFTSIAILASLCSVDIFPSTYVASSLIAGHLGTCLAISQDRTKVLVSYPPEPLVTEVAHEILNDAILHRIASAIGQGIVESGKRGEIVGELILVLTRQSFKKDA